MPNVFYYVSTYTYFIILTHKFIGGEMPVLRRRTGFGLLAYQNSFSWSDWFLGNRGYRAQACSPVADGEGMRHFILVPRCGGSSDTEFGISPQLLFARASSHFWRDKRAASLVEVSLRWHARESGAQHRPSWWIVRAPRIHEVM
jgi:hypothetical protein